MEKLTVAKTTLCGALGVAGSFIAQLFGGWTNDLTTLVIFMTVDFATGLLVAFTCNSTKTESGGLSSTVGLKGLAKKIMILLFVMVAYRIDLTLGSTYVKTTVIVAFIVNEVISITENAGLLGLPLPSVIQKAIDILKGKGEIDNEKRD